jgi:hypothetical protein
MPVYALCASELKHVLIRNSCPLLLEHQNLQEYADEEGKKIGFESSDAAHFRLFAIASSRSFPDLVYGCSELSNADAFIDQMQALGLYFLLCECVWKKGGREGGRKCE